MQKVVKWVGGIALWSAAVLITVLASAAPGDVLYVKRGPEVVLSGPQKILLRDAILAPFADVTVANLEGYYCSRYLQADGDIPQGSVSCVAISEETLSLSDAVDLELSGIALPEGEVDGDNITFKKRIGPEILDAAGKALHKAFLDSAIEKDVDIIVDFLCGRRGSDIVCQANSLASGSPAEYFADRDNKLVVRPVGRVE